MPGVLRADQKTIHSSIIEEGLESVDIGSIELLGVATPALWDIIPDGMEGPSIIALTKAATEGPGMDMGG
jgi:hypothetical protein